MEDFSKYLESLLITSSRLIVCGDFNFHMNDLHHPDAKKFQELIDSTGLKQHVEVATHKSGHTLDILLTRESESISSLDVHEDLISDHCAVQFEINLSKPSLPTKEIQYRKIKSINIDEFKGDITRSGLLEREGSLDELVGAE